MNQSLYFPKLTGIATYSFRIRIPHIPPYVTILSSLIILFVLAGCDSSTDLSISESLEFEYIEVDSTKMLSLEILSDQDSTVSEQPQIEFVSGRSLIKRFSTYSDFHFISGVVADEARLMGSPILINESLKEYIRFEHTIPLSDLSLLNHNGRVVIADTLYSLHGNSYSVLPLFRWVYRF